MPGRSFGTCTIISYFIPVSPLASVRAYVSTDYKLHADVAVLDHISTSAKRGIRAGVTLGDLSYRLHHTTIPSDSVPTTPTVMNANAD